LARLNQRDGAQYSQERLAELARRESMHAGRVCAALSVPLVRCDSSISEAAIAGMIRDALGQ
jgi:hypothetical protein